MRTRIWLPVALFAAGICMIVAAVATGEADVSLVVIFPVVSGSGGVFLLGMALVVFSLLSGFALMAMGQAELAQNQEFAMPGPKGTTERSKDTRFGGVVLVGPIPIAFGSSMRMAIMMLIAGIVIAIVALAIILMAVD